MVLILWRMWFRILRRWSWLALGMLACGPACARVAEARIARVVTPVAVLEGVRLRVDWPAGAR